jgi:hypothetical protein
MAVWAIVAFALAGCKTCDLVEAELRYQSRRVRQLEQCLCEKQAEIDTLQATLDGRSDKPPGEKTDTAEDVYRRTALSKVSLGPGTGGRDLDRDGSNEAVQFTIACFDYDGDSFKCPGQAEVELLSYDESGRQESVGLWIFEPEELRQQWKSSMLGSGYQLIIPVASSSTADKWRFQVRFTTLDGRVFEDGRDVTMKLGSPRTQTLPCEFRASVRRMAPGPPLGSVASDHHLVSAITNDDESRTTALPIGARQSARLQKPILLIQEK